jgi:hypothetical protein
VVDRVEPSAQRDREVIAGVGEGGAFELGNLTGIGLAGVLLALVFRTLWRQEGGWRSVLTASIGDATAARADAELAREDARAAREDARKAREDAERARDAEAECRRRVQSLQRQLDRLVERLDQTDRHVGRLEQTEHLGPLLDDDPPPTH